jgi:hypothetical protein
MEKNDPKTWVLAAGVLVLLMQGGFALVTSGLCRAKSAGQVVTMNFMIYPLGILGFWACGFALMFGGGSHEPVLGAAQWVLGHGSPALNKEWGPGMFGHRGFFLSSLGTDPMIFRLFFYQAAVVTVAAAIPAGVMPGRCPLLCSAIGFGEAAGSRSWGKILAWAMAMWILPVHRLSTWLEASSDWRARLCWGLASANTPATDGPARCRGIIWFMWRWEH